MVGHVLERDGAAVGNVEDQIAAVGVETLERTVCDLNRVVVIEVLDEKSAVGDLNELGHVVGGDDGVDASAGVESGVLAAVGDPIVAVAAEHHDP